MLFRRDISKWWSLMPLWERIPRPGANPESSTWLIPLTSTFSSTKSPFGFTTLKGLGRFGLMAAWEAATSSSSVYSGSFFGKKSSGYISPSASNARIPFATFLFEDGSNRQGHKIFDMFLHIFKGTLTFISRMVLPSWKKLGWFLVII